jgi:pSer/pThr/pTyr-binding forkhead associated (FHA) protein
LTEIDGDIYLNTIDEGAEEGLFINGEKVECESKLKHMDRIIFGTNSIFIFKNPSKATEIKRGSIPV